MWEGVIMVPFEHKEFLKSLGVVLGQYDYKTGEFLDCKVSNAALEKLDPYWHTYYWSLY